MKPKKYIDWIDVEFYINKCIEVEYSDIFEHQSSW